MNGTLKAPTPISNPTLPRSQVMQLLGYKIRNIKQEKLIKQTEKKKREKNKKQMDAVVAPYYYYLNPKQENKKITEKLCLCFEARNTVVIEKSNKKLLALLTSHVLTRIKWRLVCRTCIQWIIDT